MATLRVRSAKGWALRVALVVYLAASLLHFVHNAEFAADWPNLPPELTRTVVYAAWLAITALGGLGYVFWRRGWPRTGAALLALYAAIGFDGLLHYTRAPLMVHTSAMNFSIWFEAFAAVLLLLAIAVTFCKGAPTR